MCRAGTLASREEKKGADMTERFETATVGQIVEADSRAPGVFEQFGIDYCCGGRRLLLDACRAADADPGAVIGALAALPPINGDADDVTTRPLDQLVDYIVTTHHAYVRSKLPAIARHLAKLQEAHGKRHPELTRVAAVFDGLSRDLEQHLLKEEQILFPYVRNLVEHSDERCGALMSPFGSVSHPIRMMEREHEEAGEALREIRTLTGEYAVPADGCSTYDVCMKELEEFERDLHRHVHLENNVLFPRAIELETGDISA
jgi:regulator of cell morphogenesis and NO signaling